MSEKWGHLFNIRTLHAFPRVSATYWLHCTNTSTMTQQILYTSVWRYPLMSFTTPGLPPTFPKKYIITFFFCKISHRLIGSIKKLAESLTEVWDYSSALWVEITDREGLAKYLPSWSPQTQLCPRTTLAFGKRPLAGILLDEFRGGTVSLYGNRRHKES